MNPGIIDTNIFVTALMRDSHTSECRSFLRMLEEGTAFARLDVLVVHELTYSLPRSAKMSKPAIVSYLNEILTWPGIIADKSTLLAAIQTWSRTASLSFVDAYLGTLAKMDGCEIYTKNIKDFVPQGVTTPVRLPGTENT